MTTYTYDCLCCGDHHTESLTDQCCTCGTRAGDVGEARLHERMQQRRDQTDRQAALAEALKPTWTP